VISASFPQLGIGFLGVALAFGLTALTGAYAFGPVSGGHFNPAVLGLATAGRFSWRELGPYWVAQLLGATFAAFVLLKIAQGNIDFSLANGFVANGYDEHSPNGYTWQSGLLAEIVLTAHQPSGRQLCPREGIVSSTVAARDRRLRRILKWACRAHPRARSDNSNRKPQRVV
jgi:hypothetical protein